MSTNKYFTTINYDYSIKQLENYIYSNYIDLFAQLFLNISYIIALPHRKHYTNSTFLLCYNSLSH